MAIQQDAANRVPQNIYKNNGLTVAWRQFTSNSTPTETMSFGIDSTRCAFMIDIPFEYLSTIGSMICGYSNVGPGKSVDRMLPMQHANLYWLYAKSIPNVTFGVPTGIVYANAPQNNNGIVNGSGGATTGAYTTYPYCRCTIEFWQPNYAIIPNDGSQEWERYTIWGVEPSGEFLSRPQGNYQWTDLSGSPPAGPQNNRKFFGQKQIYLPKKRITCQWLQVPEGGLFPGMTKNIGAFPSPNLDGGMGCVNLNQWPATSGFPPQTLLFESYRAEPCILPINPSLCGVTSSYNVARFWNITMHFLHFDPPYGNEDYRGHNLLPQSDNKFWPIEAVNGANPPYEDYDFDTLWLMN